MLRAVAQRTNLVGQSGLPVIIPSSSLTGIQANGTVTFDTALPTGLGTTNTRCWMFFPANAISGDTTGGLYYCVLSSSTVAQIYAGKVGGATGVTTAFTPFVPTTLTAAAPGTVPIYTPSVNTFITLAAVTIPGGAMGPNGQIYYTQQLRFSNTATGKATQVTFGGISLSQISGFGSTDAIVGGGFITNQARQTSQAVITNSGNALPFYAGGVANAYISANTAIDQLLAFTLRLNTAATDVIVLEAFSVQVLFSP